MSTLEVLQSCPAQRKSLLNAIGAIDSANASLLFFDTENSEPHLPHTIALHISVCCLRNNVHQIVLDEGATTCIMSLSYWQALGSPTLSTSKTILKAFDGYLFTPHGILTAFPIALQGKIVTIEVEVVNAPLDYNLLLGCSWFYPMKVVASTFYRLVHFPHEGKIVSIDQLDYCMPNLRFESATNVPLVSESSKVPKLIGEGLFKDPCLMGVFPPPVPDAVVTPINMISFISTHLGDPWVIPNPSEVEYYGDVMLLSWDELSYCAIQYETASNACFLQEVELDQYSLPKWVEIPSSPSYDFLSETLLSNEAILKAMIMSEIPWEDYHHQSSILPTFSKANTPLQMQVSTINGENTSHVPSTSYEASSEGNMSNILKTITIDISVKPGVMETIKIGARCSPKEITLYKALF